GDHAYVLGPGRFNEEAFRTLDLAIDVAGKKGVRLIIPLVDNWKWHGGRGEYAAFRGKQPDDFWTDEQLIADFEQTVRHVLTRVNTRTGVAYRDDPAILGWETGNELDSPPAWTRRIAALVKQLDPNHLVIDGNSLHGVPVHSLHDPNIDVITTHHYPDASRSSFVPAILAARRQAAGKKPYFVGEFGFTTADEIARVYDAVIQHGVSGALLWSLRYHHRDGGFYWHSEPSGGRLYKAYHWPGFSSGEAYEERRVMALTRAKAFEIRGLAPPPLAPPAAPVLLPIDDVAAISWQGSAGATDYLVERAEDAGGPWRVVADGVDDAAVQYRPLFNDASAQPGRNYYYRVAARNGAGVSAPSNVVGPIAVASYALVDQCRDLSKLAAYDGAVEPVRGDARQRREDEHRLALAAGASITYEASEPIDGWTAVVFRGDGAPEAAAAYSTDGRRFQPVRLAQRSSGRDGQDYGYLEQVQLSDERPPAGARYLRITAAPREDSQTPSPPLEVSWIEISYGDGGARPKRKGG
ncbi:MAG: hypothetical protein DCC67_19440, partial [Planctomycetota bacterium]